VIKMKANLTIIISGKVQGVFFRTGVQNEAKKLGLTGYAANLENGAVEVVAEGEKEKLEELLMWCWHGPKGAMVADLEFSWGETTEGFDEFEVKQE